jgi:phytol kinase
MRLVMVKTDHIISRGSLCNVLGPNVGLVVAGHLYLAVVLAAAETARRLYRMRPALTRKAAHAALSLWCIPTVLFIEDFGAGLALPLSLLAISWISFRTGWLRSIEDAGHTIGNVLFAVSYVVLLALLWAPHAHAPHSDRGYLAVAAILSMGLGDSAAAIAGRRFGTRRLKILAHARTMEGMLAMFLVSGAAMAPVLAQIGGHDSHQAVAFSLIAATVAASVEPVSPYGTDNLSVPFSVALTLYVLVRLTAL